MNSLIIKKEKELRFLLSNYLTELTRLRGGNIRCRDEGNLKRGMAAEPWDSKAGCVGDGFFSFHSFFLFVQKVIPTVSALCLVLKRPRRPALEGAPRWIPLSFIVVLMKRVIKRKGNVYEGRFWQIMYRLLSLPPPSPSKYISNISVSQRI